MLLIQQYQSAYGAEVLYHDRGYPHGSVSLAESIVESVEELAEEWVSHSLRTLLELCHPCPLDSSESSPTVHAG